MLQKLLEHIALLMTDKYFKEVGSKSLSLMLVNIFTKAIRDHWRETAIGTVSIALFYFFAMSVYRNIYLGIYTELPEAFRTMMGIPTGADVGSLAISILFKSYGAWALAGLMIANGSASIASEESKGIIGLLLGNPKSRTNVLVSKAASMLLLISLAVAFLWGSAYLLAGVLDFDRGGTRAFGTCLVMNENYKDWPK